MFPRLTCESVTITLHVGEKSAFPALLKIMSVGTELGSYLEWMLAELKQERKIQGHPLHLPAIFYSLIGPYKVTQTTECILQLFVRNVLMA